jgi:hypothetical protein
MSGLYLSGAKLSETLYKNVLINRKTYSLSTFDVMLFGFLIYLSRTRVFIQLTTSQLAEEICEPYSKVSKSIKALGDINLVRKVAYKEKRGIMVSPEIINNGTNKIRAFKVKLWQGETNTRRPKEIAPERIYPIQRKSENDENLHSS